MYDKYTEEGIWTENVWRNKNVIEMNHQLYKEAIVPHKEGDKPWILCNIIKGPHKEFTYSTFLMKTLILVQEKYGDKVNTAWFPSRDEMIRESLDELMAPQCYYIIDGTYYLFNKMEHNINHYFMMMEDPVQRSFMKKSYPILPMVNKLTIYPEYWKRAIAKKISKPLRELFESHVRRTDYLTNE